MNLSRDIANRDWHISELYEYGTICSQFGPAHLDPCPTSQRLQQLKKQPATCAVAAPSSVFQSYCLMCAGKPGMVLPSFSCGCDFPARSENVTVV